MWFDLKNIEAIDSPVVVIVQERLQANIAALLRLVPEAARLRPHVKTHKMLEVTRLLLEAGITQFKAATIAEAEMVALAGAPDVLLAYQATGPKVQRLGALRAAYPGTAFSCLVDTVSVAQELSRAFAAQPLSVYLDLNVGMNRTGIAPAQALALYQQCQDLPGLHVVGLHAYDGHINDTDLSVRQQRTDQVLALTRRAQTDIAAATGHRLALVMGGSPTFFNHAQHPDVVVSPGTFVFWDAFYQEALPDMPFQPAAILVTRVLSVVNEQTITLDLGHKAVAAERPLPRVRFLNLPEGVPIGQSEEHLVVRVPSSAGFVVGTVVYAVPIHVCPTIALYESVYVARDQECYTTWKVSARNRMITV
ncbi:D-TA family PLP-dependent enzyme [Hymenobacter sp. BT635]|uniref:D-TA family PLP-dependent enzyme n=1 Tax=Hymenobacter nitidus TaxID=2880929 RepID=A0ABS8AC26_9BACT|nr:D-TA family PLP-dependent enzyme [Hymenobacter nitidus]MCB2376584.1 D-TA family PLP-dependent enzyme [Hymenobacter nitidus]